MNRSDFLKTLALTPVLTNTMDTQNLSKWAEGLPNSPKMPVLFLGHGSPMNAIEENEFVKGFRNTAQSIPTKPVAVLCVSAHWETRGTMVTAMEHPRTIHDFGGFPKALFDVQYPAPGSPMLAKEMQSLITTSPVELDNQWGLDHGAWSVIKHLYPKANVPVVQLSLDVNKTPQQHYELAKELSKLRHKGVLIVGSGNMVHNLRMVAWDKINANYAYDWAAEAQSQMSKHIVERNHEALIDFRKQGRAFDMAIPSVEHYLPLLYTLALQDKNEKASLFNNKALAGSLTMTSVKIG